MQSRYCSVFALSMRQPKLKIGVTGHRPNRFPEAGMVRVRDKLALLFPVIVRSIGQGEGTGRLDYSATVVVSALAEGADRLVVNAGFSAGFGLIAILPFTADEYARDFDSEASRADFRTLLTRANRIAVLAGQRTAPEDAYYQAGIAVLDQSNIVIAVWDGEPAHGKGGTTEIVQEAMKRGLPVLWFTPDGDGPFLLVDFAENVADIHAPKRTATDGSKVDHDTLARLLAIYHADVMSKAVR
jgi:hypothetical protein